ncbi:MAG: putative undecaprenyl-phosphate glycosylphosphotransferase, partial [Acidimicrobiales bacterium]|nr:putative undecaprenyl-phosphate glycosylphosphotransferase [Acidimicrobiales bacterium]
VRESQEERRRLLRAGLIAAVVTIALAGLVGPVGAWLAVLLAGEALGLVLSRAMARAVFRRRRQRGHHRNPTVVLGDNEEATALASTLDDDPTLGYLVTGVVDPASFGIDEPVSRTGAVALAAAIRESGATGVVIAATAVDLASGNVLARELSDAGLHVELSSALRDLSARRLSVGSLGRFATLHLEPVHRDGWRAATKRAVDVLFAVLALVLIAPALTLIVLAIRLTSRGPVLFRQERVGRDGVMFPMFKLRTMFVGSEDMVIDLREAEDGTALFKPARDPRVTPVGRVLRKLSLDELPQLWNVLRGEMSLVGPRPALASEMAMWSPELHGRLRVRPGITGLWQVHRQDWSIEHYTRLDLYYVDNWSLRTDLAIMGRTIPAVLFGRSNR